MREEWFAHLDELDGTFTKFSHALSCLFGAGSIQWRGNQLTRPPPYTNLFYCALGVCIGFETIAGNFSLLIVLPTGIFLFLAAIGIEVAVREALYPGTYRTPEELAAHMARLAADPRCNVVPPTGFSQLYRKIRLIF
jgi:hypothetical protein